jgi:hypothetical protein
MWKYIVTWTLVMTISTSCPNSGPNEFGETSMLSCLVYHSETIKKENSKVFLNRKDAIDFYQRGKSKLQNSSWISDGIIAIEIDSIKNIQDETNN